MSPSIRRISHAALFASAAITPMAAFAQMTPTSSQPAKQSDIIVTASRYPAPETFSATKTDTPLLEIPQAVQVITHTVIEEQDIRTLSAALVNVSGVVPAQPQEVLFTAPIIRGFPAEVYLDGLPLFGGNQQAADPASLIGVERIEVLKGPTSTLYGGGLGTPLGGLINIESERPNSQFGGYLAVRAGSFSTWNPYGDVSGTLAPGVAGRLAFEYQSNGSWIDKVEGEHWSVKPSLSFQIDARTELFLQTQFNRTGELEYSGLPAAQALAGGLDRNAFPGAPNGQPHTTNDNQMATVELRHAFSDTLRLSVSGRYYDSRVPEDGSFVYPALYAPDPTTPTVYPILPLNMVTKTKETTLDANLSEKIDFLGGSHVFLEGVDYDYTVFDSGMGFDGMTVGSIDLADPVYSLSFGAQTPINLTQTDRYQTIAAYVQDQATYGRLHLTAALRYTQLSFREIEQATDETYHHVSPRLGATFDLLSGVALYAGYATAFRGSFGFIGLEPPKPETSTNVEGGLKLALKNIGLSGTIAAFRQTRNNVATSDPTHPLYSIQTGQQRADGLESDLMWEPSPGFSLLANYAYTDSKVTRDNLMPVGDKLARVPRNSGRIAVRYRLLDGAAKGLSFGVGVTATGSRQDTLPNTVSTPGYAVADAQAAYDFRTFTLELSIINLTGRKAFVPYEYLGFPVVMPIQPTSAYVTLKTRF